MDKKKEFHRANLPHYQQPGQAYFVTWNLQDAIPALALKENSEKLSSLRYTIDYAKKINQSADYIDTLKLEFNILNKKRMKAMEDLLHLENKCSVNLSKLENTSIIHNALCYWEGQKLKNHAICVMPNHVHWVFELFQKDETGKLVWLEDILKSVKLYSSTQINLLEHKKGTLWHKESWDTTIRNDRHLYEAIEYTKNNPVLAKLVSHWMDWRGTLIFE